MTVPTVRKPRVSLAELEQDCRRCNHQNGGHTGGASRSGWAPFDPTWANATGWCMVPNDGYPGHAAAECPDEVLELAVALSLNTQVPH